MIAAGTPLPWNFTPAEALARWRGMDKQSSSRGSGVMMLHSGRPHARWARWSLLTEPQGTYRLTGSDPSDARAMWIGPDTLGLANRLTGDPWRDLRLLLSSGGDGLWVGYISYDLGRWVESLPSVARADRDWPIIELGYCPGWLRHDTLTGQWSACGAWQANGAIHLLQKNAELAESPLKVGPPQSVFERQQYEQTVARVIDYISAGDIFQANLSQRFTATTRGSYPQPQRRLFTELSRISPAWYGAYLELSDAGDQQPRRVLASTSPELFLEVTGSDVITRPIKGTRPAFASATELLESAKDRAELNMIVDLLRNDLGRVCRFGSVRVQDARQIETHPTVHHTVATIAGSLRDECDTVDLLRATLPGGSITGAPKIRAMQIIDELERVRRGPYCGCIGVLSNDYTCLNIAIRTLALEQQPDGTGIVDFSVGGGIVADSVPSQEYQETLDKARAMLDSLTAVSQSSSDPFPIQHHPSSPTPAGAAGAEPQ
jgi:para-aminobenzoate synthetase component I